jgi:hypothetical protein
LRSPNFQLVKQIVREGFDSQICHSASSNTASVARVYGPVK